MASKLFVFMLLYLRSVSFFWSMPLLRRYLRFGVLQTLSLVIACWLYLLVELPPTVFSEEAQLPAVLSLGFMLCVLREILLGFSLALPLILVGESYQMAGRLADFFRGSQLGEQMNPELGQPATMLEGSAGLLLLGVVFASGAYVSVLGPLASSVQLLAPWVPSSAAHDFMESFLSWPNIQGLILLAGESLLGALLFVSPLLVAALGVELVGGMLNRLLPRVMIQAELAPLKLSLGLILLVCMLSLSGDKMPFCAQALHYQQGILE